MLGLDVLKSPTELYEDLLSKDFITNGNPTEEYVSSYEWLRDKVEKIDNSKCSQVCQDIYNKL